MTFGPRLRLFWISSVFTRCDLEDESEGGVTLEALEKASKDMGFKEFLRYVLLVRFSEVCCPKLVP